MDDYKYVYWEYWNGNSGPYFSKDHLVKGPTKKGDTTLCGIPLGRETAYSVSIVDVLTGTMCKRCAKVYAGIRKERNDA